MLTKLLNKKLILGSIGLLIVIFLAQAFPYNQVRYSCINHYSLSLNNKNIIIEKYLINPLLFDKDFLKNEYWWYEDFFNVVTLQKLKSCGYIRITDKIYCRDPKSETTESFDFGLKKYVVRRGSDFTYYICTPYENPF